MAIQVIKIVFFTWIVLGLNDQDGKTDHENVRVKMQEFTYYTRPNNNKCKNKHKSSQQILTTWLLLKGQRNV